MIGDVIGTLRPERNAVTMPPAADVVEPVDTPDLKSVGSNAVRVRVPPSAPLPRTRLDEGLDGTVSEPIPLVRRRDVVVAHASDVHIDDGYTARLFGGDGAGPLRAVLKAAKEARADIVVLAGDTFECNRLPAHLLERTAATIDEFGMPVVILPGNHDPATDDAVFRHPALLGLPGLTVLGVTHDETVHFMQFDLEVWGRAHRDYGDMDPLAAPRPRTSAWQIAMAHGHHTPIPDRSTKVRASWLIGDDEIDATAADYLALGHWNRRVQVGSGTVPAWYSGSPDYARSINIVRLSGNAGVTVDRHRLELPPDFGDGIMEGQD